MRRGARGAVHPGHGAADGEGEQVAVAGEALAEPRREPGKGGAVAEQQVRASERAGREHEVVRRHRDARKHARVGLAPLVLVGVLDVVDGPAAALARLELAHLAAGADLGAVVPRGGQVVVVERVLRAVVAADVAFADEPAGLPRAPVDVGPLLLDRLSRNRVLAGVAERDRERRAEPVHVALLGRGLERERLRRAVVGSMFERIALGGEHLLGAVVVRVEVCAGERPGLAARAGPLGRHEPLLVLAQKHVRVDQRAAAETARDQGVEPRERPQVEQPLKPFARVPEVVLEADRAAREGARRVCLAALEHEHPAVRLGQPLSGDRASKSGSDDDAVEVLWSSRHAQPSAPGRSGFHTKYQHSAPHMTITAAQRRSLIFIHFCRSVRRRASSLHAGLDLAVDRLDSPPADAGGGEQSEQRR